MTAGPSLGHGQVDEAPLDWPGLSGLSAVIGWLPVASLLLARDGTAIVANEQWAALSGVPVRDSLGDGWLQAVNALDRIALRAQLQDAAASGMDGSADMRIATPGAERWSRWSWEPVPSRLLIVSVVGLAEGPPLGADAPVASGLANTVVHRLFGVRVLLQYAAALTDAHGRSSLEKAVDELDSVIRDVRIRVFAGHTVTDLLDP